MAITWQHLSKKCLCYRICSVLSDDPGFHVTIWSSHSDNSSNVDEFTLFFSLCNTVIDTEQFVLFLSYQGTCTLTQAAVCSFRPELLFGQLQQVLQCNALTWQHLHTHTKCTRRLKCCAEELCLLPHHTHLHCKLAFGWQAVMPAQPPYPSSDATHYCYT